MAKGTETKGTELTRREQYSPFSLVSRIFDDMDDIFGFGPLAHFEGTSWPQIDVRESNGKLVVRADMPGVKKDDVKLEVTDDALVIEGERKFESEKTEGGVYRSECRYGSFYRRIPLPEGIDASNATADFKDGVLTVSLALPKQKEAKSRRIEIGGAAAKPAEKEKEQPAVH